MKRKAIAVMLTFVMFAMVFTACSVSADKENRTEVTEVTSYDKTAKESVSESQSAENTTVDNVSETKAEKDSAVKSTTALRREKVKTTTNVTAETKKNAAEKSTARTVTAQRSSAETTAKTTVKTTAKSESTAEKSSDEKKNTTAKKAAEDKKSETTKKETASHTAETTPNGYTIGVDNITSDEIKWVVSEGKKYVKTLGCSIDSSLTISNSCWEGYISTNQPNKEKCLEELKELVKAEYDACMRSGWKKVDFNFQVVKENGRNHIYVLYY